MVPKTELNIVHLFAIVRNRIWLGASAFILSLAVAGVYLLLVPPLYEARVLVQSAIVNGKQVELPTVTARVAISSLGLRYASFGPRDYPRVISFKPEVTTKPEEARLLGIETLGHSARQAADLGTKVADTFVRRQNQIVDQSITVTKQQIH